MSGTPYGLLGTPTLGQQPGSGLGSLYNAVVPPSTWGGGQVPIVSGIPGLQWNAAPGTQWNGPGTALQTAPPAPAPPPTYDQWGRMVGPNAVPNAAQNVTPNPVPNMNTGPGLPSAYGTSGYDQWGRMAPQPVQAQQAPQQQGFDASGIDPRTMAALSASAPGLAVMAALSGLPNPYAGVPLGRGGGLLGNAVAGDGGGAGGDRGPSQGNQGQQDAATAAGGMAASGDTGPSAGGGSAASGHDQDEEGPF